MKKYLDNFVQKPQHVFNTVATFLALVFLVSANNAFAQPHEYIFNNNFNEYNGGPSLTEITACGATTGSYGVQTAGTTSGVCLTSNSFCFNDGGGLQYPNPGLVTNSYTIHVLFRFSNLGGYARIIDFSNSTADAGIYFLGNCLNLYPNGNVGTCPYFTTNTYYLITFVRDGNTGIISVYVDGTLFGTYNDSGNLYRPATATTPINFFRDDNVVTCETQPGCVKYISVSPTVATASDVMQTWTNITNVIHATPAASPVITVTPPDTLTCINTSSTLFASSTGTVVWNGGALSINEPNPATVTASGDYMVSVIDVNGCVDTVIVTVAINTISPGVTANSSGNLSCSSASVTLTGNSPGNTMVWNGGTLSNAANPAIVSAPGTYTVTATDAVNGCTGTATVTVTNDTSQQLNIFVNSVTICSGQTATLTASGASSYSWSTGATASTIGVSPTSTTSYTVTGTTGACSNNAIATVTLSTNLAITVNSPTICTGQTATLTADGATTYSWSTGSATNPLTISPTTTTSYTVTGTASSCTGSAVATVTVNAPPVVTANSVTICSGSTATLTATGGSTYLWSTGATTASVTDTPATTTTYTVIGTTGGCSDTATASVAITPSPVVTVNISTICQGDTAVLTANGASGYVWSNSSTTNPISVVPLVTTTYTVVGTSSGCTDTALASVTVIPLPPITVTSASICTGGTGTITANGATAYLWSTGVTGSTLTASPAITTTYTVTGTASGCTDTATGTITVNPFLTVDLTGAASICSGSSTTISATAQFGSSGSYSYSWAPSVTGTGASVTVSPTVTTTYTITANDGCSPPATDTVTVTILPSPIVSFTADINSGCAPLCVNFTNTSIVPGGSIATQSWDFGADQPTVQNCFTNPGQYSVTLTATSNAGCSATYTNANMITVVPYPVASFSAPPATGLIDPVVNFTDISIAASSWSWNFDDSLSSASDNVSTLQNPSHAYSDTGYYCVSLIVGNAFGCYDSIISCISVEPDFTCFIPNSFSPDDNDLNDEFYCIAQNIKDFEMRIYDRWGNLFFFTDDITKHWDGTSQTGDIPALMDVYIYKIHLTDNRNKKHKYLGTVMLLR